MEVGSQELSGSATSATFQLEGPGEYVFSVTTVNDFSEGVETSREVSHLVKETTDPPIITTQKPTTKKPTIKPTTKKSTEKPATEKPTNKTVEEPTDESTEKPTNQTDPLPILVTEPVVAPSYGRFL